MSSMYFLKRWIKYLGMFKRFEKLAQKTCCWNESSIKQRIKRLLKDKKKKNSCFEKIVILQLYIITEYLNNKRYTIFFQSNKRNKKGFNLEKFFFLHKKEMAKKSDDSTQLNMIHLLNNGK
ncbi:hypothetical protein RFI_00448 [Reticulomyxa filosa]|uniref:Uncharacterized protein n=1 Tax=Reticulomyxa filosa TaxID=46433 RepID=X6PEY9_RETFI|nr:hypothetical protein RFI_00448 [Reticulomyxa filosa]|eukprot:ETO36614.1 hypothetical protein RFI_00448 [Reticulomyxa filosa]